MAHPIPYGSRVLPLPPNAPRRVALTAGGFGTIQAAEFWGNECVGADVLLDSTEEIRRLGAAEFRIITSPVPVSSPISIPPAPLVDVVPREPVPVFCAHETGRRAA